MDRQETFDTIVIHLFKQGRQAREGASCKYRTSDGLKCAVGCLIDDDEYFPEMEGRSVVGLLKYPKLYDKFYIDIDLLTRLQSIHDNINNWSDGGLNVHAIEDLCYLADKHNLSKKVINRKGN